MKVDLMNNIQVIKNFNIVSYEILSIHLTPSVCAMLEIIFYCDDDRLYLKKYLLKDQEYLDWEVDTYLDYFIINNILKIFNN